MKKNNEPLYQDIPVVADNQGDLQDGLISQVSKKLMWYSFSSIDNNVTVASFDQSMLFMVKLYTFLAGMLLTLYLMIVTLYFCDNFRLSFFMVYEYQDKYQQVYYETFPTFLYFISLIFTIILGLTVYFAKQTRMFPCNIISYIVFSICIGLILGAPIATNLKQPGNEQGFIIILYLFCMSVGTFACIIIFSFRKHSLAKSKYILLTIFLVMLFLVMIFFFTMRTYLWVLIVGLICHVIYGALILFEAQTILHGKFLLQINEFISGALLFYIDITIFIVYLSFCAVIVLCIAAFIAIIVGLCGAIANPK